VKKHIKNNIFLLFAIFFYLFGIILEKYQTPKPNSNIVVKFENVLHKKEKQLRNLVDSISSSLTSYEFDFNKSDTSLLNPEQIENITNQGFAVLIFKNDTLKYWTDNKYNFDKKYSNNDFSAKAFEQGNFIVETHQKKVYDYIIVGVLRIKSKYGIQNNYLKNEFLEDFDLPPSVEVSFIFTSESLNVQDIDNETIMYLTYGSETYDNPGSSLLLSLLYIISLLLLMVHSNFFFKELSRKTKKYYYIIVGIFTVIIFRILLLVFKFPVNIFSQDFFDSQYFGSSYLNSSLGDLLLNISVYFYIAYNFFYIIFNHLDLNKLKEKKYFRTILTVSLIIIGNYAFLVSLGLIEDIIINSTIPLNLYNIVNLNLFSLFAFISILLVVILAFYILYKIFELSGKITLPKYLILYSVSCFIIVNVPYYFFIRQNNPVSLLIILFINLFIILIFNRSKISKVYRFAFISVIISVLITISIILALNNKQNEFYKLKAMEMINQRDDLAEILLKDIAEKLPDDQNLYDYSSLNNDIHNIELKTYEYVTRRYFKSYWNKYDITVISCSNTDSIKLFNKNLINCNYYFDDLIQKNSINLPYENSYFINNQSLKNSYLLFCSFPESPENVRFYFIITPKLYPTNIGYPELLLNTKNSEVPKIDFSYAKYHKNSLTISYGNYEYQTNGEKLFSSEQEFSFIEEKNLKHLIYNTKDDNYIVITFNKITFWDSIVVFSYILLTFILIIGVYTLIKNYKTALNHRNWDFKTKLNLSMLLVLSLSFVLIGAITVFMNINKTNNNNHTEVTTKLKEINIALTQQIQKNDTLITKIQSKNVEDLEKKLQDLSEIVGADVNIFDKNGYLYASSRPEIFYSNLIGEYLNSTAFYQLKTNKLSIFVHKENIGLMSYTSAYAQLLNKNNELLAYINLPYFIKPDAFKEEMTNLIVSIVNIFVVLFLFSMFLSILISEQIISPIIVLQNKIKKLEVGKKYEKIEYKRKDEIGELVAEYNKMVDKLDESINLLSKSERESAWRDMAKQIAHEIKNPLTPMKLSIQLLLRSWENQDEDFDYRLRNVSNTLIQQIETLKRIAEEFSDFAKMPKPQEQIINLSDKIEQMSKFYENTDNIEVKANLNNFKNVLILADDKQISRAFINLIKNAIQAIPEGVNGKITIDLDIIGTKAIVKIIDNGSGIQDDIKEKLFLPSFTTKSSGMGIGLAMVKNIIDNANGKISFKSQLGKGTTFIIELPVYQK